jgi:hypothetical protein
MLALHVLRSAGAARFRAKAANNTHEIRRYGTCSKSSEEIQAGLAAG